MQYCLRFAINIDCGYSLETPKIECWYFLAPLNDKIPTSGHKLGFINDRSKAVVLMWSLLAVLVSEFRLCFTLYLFIILLVRFGLLSGHLLGNSCPLG